MRAPQMEVIRPSRAAFDDMMLRICRYYARPAHHMQAVFAELFNSSCDGYYGRRSKSGLPGSLRRYNKVCERFLTDQSLFNLHFRHNYLRLPYGYNAQPTRWKRPPPVQASAFAILHFIGDPKPWKPIPPSDANRFLWHETASELWSKACAVQLPASSLAEYDVQMETIAERLLLQGGGKRLARNASWQKPSRYTGQPSFKRKPSEGRIGRALGKRKGGLA